MKTLSRILPLLVLVFSFAACNNAPEGDKANTGEAQENKTNVVAAKDYAVDVAASSLGWEGAKPAGKHEGTLMLKSGNLSVKGGEIVGGNFIIDMNSIKCTDLPEGKAGDLEGHLKNEDFFDVPNHPEAKFEITEVAQGDAGTGVQKLTGNLTIKGISKSISFDTNVKVDGDHATATAAQFTIDRTEWDVKYGSKKIFKDLGDKFINDDMGISINLIAGHGDHTGHDHSHDGHDHGSHEGHDH